MMKSNGNYIDTIKIIGLDKAMEKFKQDNIFIDKKRDNELIGKDLFARINIISKYETLKKEVSPKTYNFMNSIIVDREAKFLN